MPVARVLPLIEEGYIRRVGPETVEAPSAAGLSWLRSWFQQPQAKPMFSVKDLAMLLEVEEKSIPALLAAHDIQATHDPALGLTVSMWGARRLLMEVLSKGPRFDRQALLWFLIGNPADTCPSFDEALEKEIERIAQLPEPTRSTRREALLRQWRDAQSVADVTVSKHTEKLMRKLA